MGAAIDVFGKKYCKIYKVRLRIYLLKQLQHHKRQLDKDALQTFLPVRQHRHLLGGSDFNQNLSRATGAVFNSNTELLFSGVSLRSGFSFSFDLVPRSKKESDEIKDIIRFFKSESAAQKGAHWWRCCRIIPQISKCV
jgi:hypothetical protein